MNPQRSTALTYAALGTLAAAAIWLLSRQAYSFVTPDAFWLLLLIPLLGAYDVATHEKRHARVSLSTLDQFPDTGAWATAMFAGFPRLLRYVGLAALIVALARPQSSMSWQNATTEGIDIVIAMDISASMLAKDFDPNRLESAKDVAIRFIEGRPNDRIGLVVYEGEAFTQCPLTTDHRVLINLFKEVNTGMIEGGTAIGMGLATAVNRLRESDARSRVIILLTDGDNNAGSIAPLTAAEIAESYGIRVYTIGVGSEGRALSPVAIFPDGRYKYDYVPVKIDEETLKKIAASTGGAYFRATDQQALAQVYSQIDKLEKSKINVTEHSQHSEEFYLFAWIAVGALGLEYLMRYLLLRTLT